MKKEAKATSRTCGRLVFLLAFPTATLRASLPAVFVESYWQNKRDKHNALIANSYADSHRDNYTR